MKIEHHEITIGEVFDGYVDSEEEGIVGYHGRLNIRPIYQREFIYKEKERNAVIDTVIKGFPLNSMYWVKTGDNYELMDGQQRTISICQYLNGDYSYQNKYFHSLPKEQKQKIKDYKLMIYICEGSEEHKLEWFRTINIAGKELTDQEMRNAIYTGTWLTDAKLHFSKTNCVAYNLAKKYMKGSPLRQDYLQTVLTWLSDRDDTNIEEYMSKHQNDPDAHCEWLYFKAVIDWVQAIFPKYRSNMNGLQWGLFYNKYKDKPFVPSENEALVQKLMADDDVVAKKGIYEYILDGEEKHLNLRSFTESQKRTAYAKQKGICPKCKKKYEFEEMEGDHITPWSKGGKTEPNNLQMLCKRCNREKSNK